MPLKMVHVIFKVAYQ
uniref:Uncharacterized protein n=1 Tax=Arundo donax TaxID=35708 RepID=A0A0A9EWT3_ARUDO